MTNKERSILDILPMPLEQFLAFGNSISEALQDLHRNDFIHGDIRPDNIIWEPGKLKVTLIDQTLASTGISLFNTTRLLYVSPEQTGRMNNLVDQRTDLYSLGVVFYGLLTGTLPFVSEEPLEIIHSHIAKKKKGQVAAPMQTGDSQTNFSYGDAIAGEKPRRSLPVYIWFTF